MRHHLRARALLALLSSSALSCGAPGEATSPDSWPEVRTMADCFERSVRTPLSGLRGPQAEWSPLALRVRNDIGEPHYVFRAICVLVDRRVVYVEDAETLAMQGRDSESEIRIFVPQQRPAVVRLMVQYRGAPPYAEFTFLVSSKHDLTPADVAAGVLFPHLLEKPNEPLHRRPTVVWGGPAAPP
jgi:hypothetical protein